MQTKVKKRQSIILKFVIVFLVYGVISLTLSGVVTYLNMVWSYHNDCKKDLKYVTNHLSGLIQQEGQDFIDLKNYFDEHYEEMMIPMSYDWNYKAAQDDFEKLFLKYYPNDTYGETITFNELNDEVKNAYAVYRFEYWLFIFEQTRDEFGLKYTYFLYPKEEPYMVYMFDATRDANAIYGDKYINLGFGGDEDPQKYPMMWEAWHTGSIPSDVDIFDNDYGHTYAYYAPVWIGDEQVGLVCADMAVDDVNDAIVKAVQGQVQGGLVVLVLGIFMLILVIRQIFIKRILKLERNVAQYKENKDVTIAEQIRDSDKGSDEISALSVQFSDMIIELRDYMKDLQKMTAEKERIGAELNVATKIQADMLPSIFPAFPDRQDIDLYAWMDPAKEVGGDFYDFFMVDENHLALVMADVSGKGVPAALFMVIGKTLLKNHLQSGESVEDALSGTNDQLAENNDEMLFITAWIGVIDLRTGHMDFADAGHETAIIVRATGEIEEVHPQKKKPPLAAMEGIPYRRDELVMQPGDKIFLYTDGVPEATNSSDELYGMDRLESLLNEKTDDSPYDLLVDVRGNVDAFVGDASQFDDLTMLCFKYLGPQG